MSIQRFLSCVISFLISSAFALGLSTLSSRTSHDEVQTAILEDFFQNVPISDFCVKEGSTAPTEISFNHTDPTSSNFSPQNLPYEKDLFLVEMFYPSVENPNNTWKLRLGSG
jgi:hypothetical protein